MPPEVVRNCSTVGKIWPGKKFSEYHMPHGLQHHMFIMGLLMDCLAAFDNRASDGVEHPTTFS